MAGLDKRLAPGEQVFHHLHPHAKALVGPILVLLLVCAVGGYAAAISPLVALRLVILVLGIALVVWGTVRPFLRWVTTTYTVTDRRILLRNGVLARTGRDIPLTRVTDVAFRHGLLQRLFGCGTLTVESASELGQVVLTDVPRVETVQRDLYTLVDEAGPPPGARRGDRAGHRDGEDDDDQYGDGWETTVLPYRRTRHDTARYAAGDEDGWDDAADDEDADDEDEDEDGGRRRRRGRRR